MLKRIIVFITLMLSSFFMINTISFVDAENIFHSDKEEAAEKFDYSDEDESGDNDNEDEFDDYGDDDGTEDYESDDEGISDDSSVGKEGNKQLGSKHSVGVILAEVFCGIVGLFMVFLSFRSIDS
ncbi:MAG: hypothetical protein IKF19_04850 [Bacilli bacterium]|nr:hypothetical protein [Bacilli bacterium]